MVTTNAVFGGYVRASIECPACKGTFVIDPPDLVCCPACAWTAQVHVQSFWTSVLYPGSGLDGLAVDDSGGSWRSSLRLRVDEAAPTCAGCGLELDVEALRAHLPSHSSRFPCPTCGRGMHVWNGSTWLLATLPGLELVVCATELLLDGDDRVRCFRCGQAVADIRRSESARGLEAHRPCPAYPREAQGHEPGWYAYGAIRYVSR
ncbi:hypothetical protein WMF38_53090 [Sorangium sp. So ce118]